MVKNNCVFSAILVFIASVTFHVYPSFFNYSSTIRINDLAKIGTKVFAATQGGLMVVDPVEDQVVLKSNTHEFPDLHLTSFCVDDNNNLWIGTKSGFIYRRTLDGRQRVYSTYKAAQWSINDIIFYDKYLIVGSAQGCSVFDTEKEKVIQTAYNFGTLSGVNTIEVVSKRVPESSEKNILYLGCNKGIAYIDISGNAIVTANFADASSFKTKMMDMNVTSFLNVQNTIIPRSWETVLWNDKIIQAPDSQITLHSYSIINNDSLVLSDTTVLGKLSSIVQVIYPESENQCWFGTQEHYLYKWDTTSFQQYKTNGLTFAFINRTQVASDGKIWCLSRTEPFPGNEYLPWWQGVAMMNNGWWRLYSPGNPDDFGNLHYNWSGSFLGIAEDRSGNIWIGTTGRSIKKYNPKQKKWSRYSVGIDDGKGVFYLETGEFERESKCDIITQDSSGYLWFGLWKQFGNRKPNRAGSLLCYDPSKAKPGDGDYRFYFPPSSPYHMNEPFAMSVDVTGKMFVGAGAEDKGRLVIFRPGENPLVDTAVTGYVYDNLGKIWDIKSCQDSTTWILADKKIMIHKGNSYVDVVDSTVSNPPQKILTCIEFERFERYPYTQYGDSTRTTVWAGTDGQGLVKLEVHQYINPSGIIQNAFLTSVTYYTEDDGLVSNSITYMSIDKRNGYLWIATDKGMSRFSIGHTFHALEDNENIVVYPNPYSLTKHKEIVFENVAPGADIAVYTIDGTLVEHIVDRGNNVKKNSYAWTYLWRPRQSMLPGTYYFAAKQQIQNSIFRKKTTVKKILILP